MERSFTRGNLAVINFRECPGESDVSSYSCSQPAKVCFVVG